MTRHILIISRSRGPLRDWITRRVLAHVLRPSNVHLIESEEAVEKESQQAERNGYLAAHTSVYDGQQDVDAVHTESYQHFLRYRAEMNRLSRFLGANFRGDLPDIPSPADQAIALLERFKAGRADAR